MEELARHHRLPPLESRTQAIIFTHKSLELPPVNTYDEEDPLKDSEEAERYAYLGEQVMKMIVTTIFYRSTPHLRVGRMDYDRNLILCNAHLAKWADYFGLSGKVMAAESAYAVVQRSEKIKVEMFKAYIGAAHLQHGLEVVTRWFEAIVPQSLEDARAEDEERLAREEALRIAMGNVNINDTNRSVTPPSQQGPSNPGSPTSPQPTSSGGLALFNEICVQKKLEPKWVEAKQGAAHQPTFKVMVTLIVQGETITLGEGIAMKKNQAKHIAANEAIASLRARNLT